VLPRQLHKKLEERKADNALRELGARNALVDFSSNDYLGFSKSEHIFNQAHKYLVSKNRTQNGATGSRLLSGNHDLYTEVESQICNYHNSESALIFNSGYTANIGLLSCVPQRNDIILYDELCHASLRDGITMSNAKAYKFKHNDLEDLKRHLERVTLSLSKYSREVSQNTYIVTESVFSMDGDTPDISSIVQLSETYKAHLIIDEAHAVGVFEQGLVDAPVFAKIITFGKALGCHGAAILGSQELKDYLINFSRPFIYTTALSPHTLATIKYAYQELEKTKQVPKLKEIIKFFTSELKHIGFNTFPHGEMSVGQMGFINSKSAIHCCVISGNTAVKQVAQKLQDKNFDVKAILSPTITEGKERLRFCLHSYNSKEEISDVLGLLRNLIH